MASAMGVSLATPGLVNGGVFGRARNQNHRGVFSAPHRPGRRLVRHAVTTNTVARGARDACVGSHTTRLRVPCISPSRSIHVTLRTTATRLNATGAENDLVETFGRYAGAALGVVGLSFVAGTVAAEKRADEDVPRMGVVTTDPPPVMKKSQKQTIAGGVAGANNKGKKKPMPAGVMPAKSDSKSAPQKNETKQDMLSMLTKAAAGKTNSLSKTFSFSPPKFSWGVAEAEGPREYMEDAWFVDPETFAGGYFFASVMDGHGGSASSAYLRKSLSASLSSYVANANVRSSIPGDVQTDGSPDGGYLAKSLRKGFTETDEKLINHVAALGEPECWSGSTCTAVLVNDERLVCANVGDSRALLVRKQTASSQNSVGYELSADHRPVGSNKVGRQELDRITRAGGWSVGGRVCGILAVSRAFGDYEFKGGRFDLLDDLSEEPLAKKATMASPPVVALPTVFECARDVSLDEWLVIASDGLWDTVNSQQVVSFIKQEVKKNSKIDATGLADLLVKRALRFRTQDNVAVVVVDLRDKALLAE